jgi:hypothetical protein
MRKPEEKYLNDASYYTLVNLLGCLIDSYGFTRRELVEAVNLAVTRCLDRRSTTVGSSPGEKYYRAKESQQKTPPVLAMPHGLGTSLSLIRLAHQDGRYESTDFSRRHHTRIV